MLEAIKKYWGEYWGLIGVFITCIFGFCLIGGCVHMMNDSAKNSEKRMQQMTLEQTHRIMEQTHRIMEQMLYARDERTHMCYALWRPGERSGMMTQVECSPEVINLLVK